MVDHHVLNGDHTGRSRADDVVAAHHEAAKAPITWPAAVVPVLPLSRISRAEEMLSADGRAVSSKSVVGSY